MIVTDGPVRYPLGGVLLPMVVQFMDGSKPIDITGCIVTMAIDRGTAGTTTLTGAITEATAGKAQFILPNTVLNTAGKFRWRGYRELAGQIWPTIDWFPFIVR